MQYCSEHYNHIGSSYDVKILCKEGINLIHQGFYGGVKRPQALNFKYI